MTSKEYIEIDQVCWELGQLIAEIKLKKRLKEKKELEEK